MGYNQPISNMMEYIGVESKLLALVYSLINFKRALGFSALKTVDSFISSVIVTLNIF